MGHTARFIAFGCTHVPLADPAAVAWLLDLIRRHRPSLIVHLGDLYEADSASRWPSEYDWSLEDEYREADNLLKQIRTAAPPRAACVFLPGNHDDNLTRLNRIPRKLRSRCDWRAPQYDRDGRPLNRELCQHWKTPCEYVYCRRRGVYRLGRVTFAHGYEHSQWADEAHSILLGQPFGLYVGAHTHRPLAVTQAYKTPAIPLPYWYANAGCLRDLKPPYVTRQRTHQWGHAAVIGDAATARGGRLSKQWDAETQIFKLYDAWA